MARGNRAANRAAAKAMLETPEESREALKAAQKEQADFFAQPENLVDELDNEDEDDNNENENEDENDDTNGEVEGDKEVSSPAPNVESGDEEVEDDGEGGEDEGDDGKGEKVTPESETSTEAGKPEAPKPEAEKPAAPAPEAKEEDKAKAAPETGEPKQLTNEEAAQLYGEWRGQTEELLATHHYRLDEAQVNELNENPAAVIPKLMSKVYMDSISAAFQQFTQYLPRMVGQVLEQREKMNSTEKAFFDKWPALIDHRDAVLRLGQSYRSANPAASMDDFINEVGAQAMVALRLTPTSASPAPVANGKDKVGAKPFKPATASPSATPAPRRSDNPFENLADEFTLEEDVNDD